MAFFNGFQDLANVQLDYCKSPADRLDEAWSYENFSSSRSYLGQSLAIDPTEQLLGHVERISFGHDDINALDVFSRMSRDDPFAPFAIPEHYRQYSADVNIYQESFPTQPYPHSQLHSSRPRQPSPIETIASTSSSVGKYISYSPDSMAYERDLDGSPTEFSPDDCLFPASTSPQAILLNKGPCCALREIQFAPDEDQESSIRYLCENDFSFAEIPLKDIYGYHVPSQPSYEEHSSTEEEHAPLYSIQMPSETHSDDEQDLDYLPNKSKPRRTVQLPKRQQQPLAPAQSKVTKRVSPKSHSNHNVKDKQSLQTIISSVHTDQQPPSRTSPFSCPLTPYGCNSTFKSKNEWKRHIKSRHLFTGFWRCDCCADNETRPNDFNRKDLFTEHLRRMHHPEKTGIANNVPKDSSQSRTKGRKVKNENKDCDKSASPMAEEFENSLSQIRERCWQHIRDAPDHAYCAFCGEAFDGHGSFEEWLEHVGQHLSDRSRQSNGNFDPREWTKDTVFRDWLLDRGFLKSGPGEGQFSLVDDVTAHKINTQALRMNGKCQSR